MCGSARPPPIINRSNTLSRKQPLVGFCPIGKFVFSHEDALRFKVQIRDRLERWNVSYVDVEAVLPDGIVRDQKHVEAVVHDFRRQGIDALFIPHCNFGTEGAAAMIAKKCAVPTLLWGLRDEAPLADGSRLRDSLCGMLATSGVMTSMHRPSPISKTAGSTMTHSGKALTDSCVPPRP